MIRPFSALADRFRGLSDTGLRIVFSVIAVTSLSWIILSATFFIRGPESDTPRVLHTDDLLWGARKTDGKPSLYVESTVTGGRAEQAGIRVGDRIVAINGRVVSGADGNALSRNAQNSLDSAPVDVPIPYVIERSGKIHELSIRLREESKKGIQRPASHRYIFLVFPLFATVWLIVGTMVALAQPRGTVQRKFFFTAATVIFAFSLPGAISTDSSATIMVGSTTKGIVVFLQFLLGVTFYPLWLRFCTTYPVDQQIFSTRVRRIFLFSPVYLYLTAAAFFGFLVLTTSGNLGTPGPAMMLLGIAFVGGLGLCFLYFYGGIFFLYLGYRRLPKEVNRRPMRLILLGACLTGFALIYFIVVIVLDSLGRNIISSLAFFYPVVLLLALPIAFGYAIFKYQVMDFRLVIKTTMVYTATMILIAGLYLALGYAIGQAFDLMFGRRFEGVIGVIGFVLFIMLFDPVKRQIQTAIENRFFPQRRNYGHHLAAYTAQLSETLGEKGIARLTARTLRLALDLDEVRVIIDDRIFADRHTETQGTVEPLSEEELEALRRVVLESRTAVQLATVDAPELESLRRTFPYAVGLHAQGRIVGMALMSAPRGGDSISGSQTPFITGVAGQGAAALEVARLYEQEIARLRYQEDLATARRIQESLLPGVMPDVAGLSISAISKPAQAVGGDYYEVIRLGPHRLLVLVADVSGKGLPASLYMAELHGMVRIAGTQCDTPREILSTINQHLYEGMSRGTFVTAGVALFDTAAGTVNVVRAGHTPLLRKHNGNVDSIVPRGMGLGLCGNGLFSNTLQQQTIPLRPGNSFILYSDGVSEAMNARSEEFGDQRLQDLVAGAHRADPVTLRDDILQAIDSFRGDAEQNDDITIVVVRVEEILEEAAGEMIPTAAVTATS